jgi:pSer/pThr/pTyr-binding forkhead associated (FHA) protein
VDVLDLAVLALRLLMVALLYAFLVVVLRGAARGLSRSATTAVSSAAPVLQLVVLEPGASSLQAGQRVDVDDGTTLGRAARADVVLADPSVSAEHARLTRVGHAWVVTDLGSTNGTRVNEAQVSGKASLANGDVLAIGHVRLQVVAR